jgi:hypothetical protein
MTSRQLIKNAEGQIIGYHVVEETRIVGTVMYPLGEQFGDKVPSRSPEAIEVWWDYLDDRVREMVRSEVAKMRVRGPGPGDVRMETDGYSAKTN